MGYVRPIAVCDCETDPFSKANADASYIPQPFVWGFYDAGFLEEDKPFRYFECTEDFVAWVKDKEYVIYAHNGGKFDYAYLKNYVAQYDEVAFINGRLSRFNIGIAEFRDSMNIFPTGLAAYKKSVFDYAILERTQRYRPGNWEKIIKYLESDCVNLFELVFEFRTRFGPALTQAAAAMKEWNKISEAEIPQTKFPRFYDHFHPFYHGGRVECFQVGVLKKRFKVVDINSAYAYAMLQKHPYTFGYAGTMGDARPGLDYATVGASFFTVRCKSQGAFPWRDPRGIIEDGSLLFPVEDTPRKYRITGHELQAAEETGTVKDLKVLTSYVFDGFTDFRKYVEYFYEEKKRAKSEGNKAGYLFAKQMLLALYGRYAMNPRRFRDYMILPPDSLGYLHPDNVKEMEGEEGRKWEFSGYFGDNVLAKSKIPPDKWRFYNVATAASITGYVRAYLWRAICASEGVMYCDTDSIAATKPHVDIGVEIGEWEIEGEFSEAYIGGKKLYAFRYVKGKEPKSQDGKRRAFKLASKGVKLTPSEIRIVASGGTVVYKPQVPTYRISGFYDKATGKRSIARYINREVSMLPRVRSKLKP